MSRELFTKEDLKKATEAFKAYDKNRPKYIVMEVKHTKLELFMNAFEFLFFMSAVAVMGYRTYQIYGCIVCDWKDVLIWSLGLIRSTLSLKVLVEALLDKAFTTSEL